MGKKIHPAVAIIAAIVVFGVVGFFSYRLLGDTGGKEAYVGGVKSPELEKHVNQPPGISAANGGGGESTKPQTGGADN